MERTITQSLIEWKYRKNRSPLILRGARQVGKTYTVEEFGRAEFENMENSSSVDLDIFLKVTEH